MTAKERLKAKADELYAQAAACHAAGMALLERSACLAQISRVISEEQAGEALKAAQADEGQTQALVTSLLRNSEGKVSN